MSRLLAVARRHPRTTAAAASVLLVGVFDVTVRLTTDPEESAAPPATTLPASTTSTSAPTTTTTSPPTNAAPAAAAPTTAPPVPIAATSPPPSSGWPTPATTGAASTAGLTGWTGGCVLDTPNQVIENVIFDCGVEISAPGVTLRNSLVRSGEEWGISVSAEQGAPAILENVTVEADSGCNAGGTALAFSNYHASRVKVLNFGTAFLFNGNNTVVQDSYAKLCGPPGSDAETTGLDGYEALDATSERPNVFHHNTVDQRCGDWRSALPDAAYPGSGNAADQACDAFATVSWWGSGSSLQVTDNLFRGGGYSITIQSGSGHTVTGNVVERASYAYGPVNGCQGVTTGSDNWEADVTEGGAASNETVLDCSG